MLEAAPKRVRAKSVALSELFIRLVGQARLSAPELTATCF